MIWEMCPASEVWSRKDAVPKGGDSITFLMEMENLTFPEAVRALGAEVGIEIAEDRKLFAAMADQAEGTKQSAKTDRLLALLDEFPDAHVSLSSEVLPRIREWPRLSTTLLNAYGNPIAHYGDLDLTMQRNRLPQEGAIDQLMA